MTPVDSVYALFDRGWMTIPVLPRSKNPGYDGWQQTSLIREELAQFFHEGQNVGVLLGAASGWLVDVDLDSDEAVRLAPAFLPGTGAIFGRTSRPRSHYLFVAPNATTTKLAIARDGKSATIVELRSTGAQTIFPGSIHPGGDSITWDEDAAPAVVDADQLVAAVSQLAAAALLAASWPRNARHDAALALAGGLLRDGWDARGAVAFVRAVAEAAHDEELEDRLRAVRDTADALLHEDKATGWPRLTQLLGKHVTTRVCAWIGHAPIASLIASSASDGAAAATIIATPPTTATTKSTAINATAKSTAINAAGSLTYATFATTLDAIEGFLRRYVAFATPAQGTATWYQIQFAAPDVYDFFVGGTWYSRKLGIQPPQEYQMIGETHDLVDQMPGAVNQHVYFDSSQYYAGSWVSVTSPIIADTSAPYGASNPWAGRYEMWDGSCAN